MLLTLQATDALWHCLCPSFRTRSIRALTGTSWPAKSSRPYFPRRARQHSTAQKTHSFTPYREYGEKLKISLSARPPEPKHEVLRHAIAVACNEQLHRELDRRAIDGDLEWVRYLTQELIYSRSEKPDSRHYHALILANTSIEHGSTGEVKRLLDELDAADVPLDSAICHAVLKVQHHTLHKLRSNIVTEHDPRRYWPSIRTMSSAPSSLKK